jgi:ribonuclease III
LAFSNLYLLFTTLLALNFYFIKEALKYLQGLFLGEPLQKDFKKQLSNVIGFKPGNALLYQTALSHRSMRDGVNENNERLEFLGDAILSSVIANYLFMKYPYKDEGFLTEMRSKMVNRQKLNDIALKMGLKKITQFNKLDNSLKKSQIFGNSLEALIGAIFLDKGFAKTKDWIELNLVKTHMFMEDLEAIEINIKNKLYGWATKNGKSLSFDTMKESIESGRRLFTMAVIVEGNIIAEAKGFSKKDASQLAAFKAVENLGL